ncbi:MAG: HlyC/CorC family transporter [Clostridia bacterium]|nr:HlyC/CorC family transporter [Clostridia bacterium]
MLDGNTISMIIAIVILIAMSAMFSATETAFNTINRVRMKNLASDGNKRAALVLKLSEDYDSLLSTILIGNNIVNISLTAIATVMIISWFPTGGTALSIAVTTVLVLIFGEVSPKSIAKEKPDSFAMTVAPVIRVVMVLFTPLNFFFRMWKKLLAKIFKLGGTQAMTDDEIMTIVDEAQQDGGIDEQEGELIRSAIEFVDAETADIITPRVDVVAIEKDTSFEEITEIFHTTGFSRLPVYEETIDNIIGILHEKDFFYTCKEGNSDIISVLKKPFLITCHVKISKLLTQFQQAKAHMAVVLDDYGGTMGIVTLEDVIEELVGDIWDEHDEVIEQVTENSDGTVTLTGDTRTLELFELFEMQPEDEDELPQTVSGWVTMQLGEFPEAGIAFDYEALHVEVTKVDDKLVEEVKITKLTPEEASEKSDDAE